MARELHDTLAQGVTGLVLQLEAVRAHLGANRNDRAAAIIEQALGRARSTLAESRAAIDDLRAEPVSLPESIREKVDRFTQATSISCKSEIMVKENQLSPETTTHILNIFSEALANIARHAQATQVHVNFAVQNRTLDMEIRDNGMGFDVCQQTSGHYGLLGMHERARLAGGNLTIESNKNGTYLHLVIGRQG
jgi:NarL family two-component system sensor histidine kinase YdfH